MTERLDCVVIGAGVVGLAIARALVERGRNVTVIEAESAIGKGASSRNSEVIHAGIYYPSDSLKARLCVKGKEALYAYCRERDIPHNRIGKIIVALSSEQEAILDGYLGQARANGVDDLVWLSREELREREPQIAGVRALFSPSTGIVDSHAYMASLDADIHAGDGTVVLNSPVLRGSASGGAISLEIGGRDPVTVEAASVVNAAGLAAQEVARSIDGLPGRAVPRRYLAKGCYFSLSGRPPFRHLVYPVAEEGGLGVHVTLDMGGQARFGPNVMWIDSIDYGFPPGLKGAFAEAIERYYPGLNRDRLQEGYTGIRPKLSGPGAPNADFVIQGPSAHGVKGLVNLFGIESPGLTASLAIADYVADMVAAG